MVSLPIFIILLGILMVASNNTRIPTQNDPRAQTFATLTADTQVTFDSPEPLPGVGTYKVTSRHIESPAWCSCTAPVMAEHATTRSATSPRA